MMEIDVDQSGNNIEGTVTDSESGEPLVGANIITQETNTGTVSDENGRFNISNTNGETSRIMVSYIGYRTAQLNL